MRMISTLMVALLLSAAVQGSEELPLQVRPIGDRLLVISALTGNSTAVAINSEKGIVMIDAFWSPSIAREARATIEASFGRSGFVYVINTGPGLLSTGGNEAFSDATLVGHQAVREELIERADGLSPLLRDRRQEFEERVARARQRLATLDPRSDDAVETRRWMHLCERIANDFATGYRVTPPELTFSEHLTLDLGDLTAHLIHVGRAASGGDIVVHVPELSVVMLGDLFHYHHVLPLEDRPATGIEVPRWIEVLDGVLAGGAAVTHVIRANGKRIWSRHDLEERRRFIGDLWAEIESAERAGDGLQALLARLSRVEETFPYIAAWGLDPTIGTEIVRADIRRTASIVWRMTRQSAAYELEEVLRTSGIDAALARLGELPTTRGGYYFLEDEFNGAGYRLLGEGKVAEAIGLFRIAVERFPQSWNLHDSLGEGYMTAGERERAIESYQRSLELNPENENGRRMLEQLGYEE